MFKRKKRKRVAGLRLILIKNFRTRVQINLINYSAVSDKPHEHLLTYYNYEIKIVNARPMNTKHLMATASALLLMLLSAGSPNAL